ncbi:DEAD/DEAH box helicase [Thiorhodococcus mannitoliphagus]|uniref:DEAD/DEAH box helicase n=1 Tax=Thiorhodococcus mannitoliphagus TaxID=329406 RepID=A0A6P1E1V7_9GAMM|nr:DEAD/DEAH box helicase [Thiorhodococcus mannitoliphagus]NEX21984.1 DEAD/DEAH box helicase [Thiorhodococcus mannitoliphagus]
MTQLSSNDSGAQTQNASGADPLLLDTEQLERLADAAVVRAALRHSNEHRVTALDRGDEGLWAEVEDEGSGDKLQVEIAVDAGGDILAGCDCQAAGNGGARLCVHAIAALFAYSKGQGDVQQLADAAQTAIEERILKARAEVRVEPISEGAEGAGFGLWTARSLQSTTHFPVSYRVHIRSLVRRANYCTCPDFATNELGTCKHIEAVLHRMRKRKDYASLKGQGAPVAYVYLDWECEDAPLIRLHRGAEPTVVDLNPILQQHFDAEGRFRLRIPDDFLRFAEQVKDRGDLLVGDDALDFSRRLAEDAARAIRADEIGSRIRAGGGRLPGIAARLYPYQVEGVAFLAGRGRALLADDMGLGKTLQAIAAAYWLHNYDGVERVLVVCPASLKQQWAREIAKFTDTEAHVIQGPVDARAVQYRQGRGFYVVNYELVMRDHSVINAELCPDLLILDEAQRIKNWRTKIANAVKRIQSRYAFVLTGTPLENRLEDLYSLMQVVDARVLGPLWRYMVDFHITDERGKVLGYRNLSELRRRLATAMLRRDRSLVRDQLPERIVQRIDVPMTEAQQAIHDDALQAATMLAQIMKRRPLTPSEQNRMMAALQRARMACNAAGLVDKETEGAPKLDELENILDELCRMAGLKAVVFSQWERMTELVERRIRRMGLGSVRLHGGVPTHKRGELMDRFRDDDAIQVFISTDAGGTGLNLQNAAVLVNLDIPWNPAVLDQRIARVHRLGQRQKVQAVLLVAASSYEERVLELVQGKRHLFDNVVDPNATEDVVSVSKRLAEVLADDLADAKVEPEAATTEPVATSTETTQPDTAESAAALVSITGESSQPVARGNGSDQVVRECILELQQRFGARIARILLQKRDDGVGKSRGLLVVLDRVSQDDDAAIEGLLEQVPLALIDCRTLASLGRLGTASPVADAESVFETETASFEPPAEHPLLRRAREGLEAATLLARQSCPGPAAELLLTALLAAAAHRAGREDPPAAQQVGVWLYAEALPTGALTADDAALLMRAVALAQGGQALPQELLETLIEDVSTFVAISAQG